MQSRPRRNRRTQAIREMVRETRLHTSHLIYPLFLLEAEKARNPIASLPGQFQLGLHDLLSEIEASMELGIRNFVLFPAVSENHKDKTATYSYQSDNFYVKAIRAVKQRFPDCCLMSDVAMDPYSSDGHDGFVDDNGMIDNDKTLPILASMSLAQADAGIDILGPSDMMDGRVGFLRENLDNEGFQHVSIMAYTAKYASAFYGPFREALDSAPKSGDKKTYQMDYANRREAVRETLLDQAEGADMLMIKPALSYLDVIQDVKAHSHLPIAAYNVSGEYAMIKAASAKGWIDETAAMLETLTSIRRAGADIILTYFAKDFAQLQS